MGSVSSWNFVAEDYAIPDGLFDELRAAGTGIRTEGHLTPEQLGFSGVHQERYQPSHWTALPRTLARRHGYAR